MNFRQFLEVSHGNHQPTKYDEILHVQLQNVLEKVSDGKTIIKFAYNCAKDCGNQDPEVMKTFKDWIDDENSVNEAELRGIFDDFGVIQGAVAGTILNYLQNIPNYHMAGDTAWQAAWYLARKEIKTPKAARLAYEENMKHYIAIAKGLSSTSQYKSKTISEIDPSKEDFIERLAIMFDEMENDTLNDEEPLLIQTSNGKYLNLPEFTTPIRISGKDNFDLAEKIYNSNLKYSLFNYIKHIHEK